MDALEQALDTAPHVYLSDRKIVGSEPIEPVLEEHLVSPKIAMEPFTAEVYEKFLRNRSEQIMKEISKLSGDPFLNSRLDSLGL